MKKLLLLIALLLAPVVWAQSPYIITGNVTDAGGNIATSGYVEFDIQPTTQGLLYYINGINTIAPQSVMCGINGSGQLQNISLTGPCNVWGNDQITPANTLYKVTFAPAQTVTNTVSNVLINVSCTNINTPCFGSPVQIVPQSALVIGPQIQSNLIPLANGVFSLGSPSLRYASGWINNLTVMNCTGCTNGSGSVSNVSTSGSPCLVNLFSCTVSTPTTTPVLNFSPIPAAAGTIFGNPSGSSANPGFNLPAAYGVPALSGNNLWNGTDSFESMYEVDSVLLVDGTHFTTIASAIAALPSSGGLIDLPCGTYTQSASLVVPSNVKIHGICGMGNTTQYGARIVAASGSVNPLIEVQGATAASRTTNVTFEDITIQGVYTVSQDCMQVDHATYITFEHIQYVSCGQAEWDDDVYRSTHRDVNYYQSGSGGTNTSATVRVENTSNPSTPSEQIFFDNCVWEGGSQQGTAIYFGPATEEEHVYGSKMDYGSSATFPIISIYQAQIVDIAHDEINGFGMSTAQGVVEIEGTSGTPAFQIHVNDNNEIAFSNTVPAVWADYVEDLEVLGGTFEGQGSGTAIVLTANARGAGIGPFRMASLDTPVTDASGLAGIIYSDPSLGQIDINNLDITGTLTIGTSKYPNVYACGDVNPCSPALLSNSKIIDGFGAYILSSGTLTVTGFPYTSSSTWICHAWDITTPSNVVSSGINSGSSVTFTGTGSDHFTFQCIGN